MAPWRWLWGLSPSETVQIFTLRWTKYARGWNDEETYIEEVKKLRELERKWQDSRICEWLSKK